MNQNHKTLLLVLVFSVLAVAVASIWSTIWATVAVFAVIVAILWITRPIWLPSDYGRTRIRIASLFLAFSFIGSYVTWGPLVNRLYRNVIEPGFAQRWPWWPTNLQIETAPSLSILAFLLLVILIVNRGTRGSSTLPAAVPTKEPVFRERDFKQRLESFCGMLRDDLRQIDQQSNWSSAYYTPLRAEVEIKSSRTKRSSVDLQAALRRSKGARAILLLGDPGSGKSVALRKLCFDLLAEVPKTNKVPLYLNLREWSCHVGGSKSALIESLEKFVLQSLRSRGDRFFNDFLDDYFAPMLENGRFFFVLDSFDEMPAVLDVEEGSATIDMLSSAIHGFLAGAHQSGGILASRLFRRPGGSFLAERVMEIRPLSEDRIALALKRFGNFDENLSRLLFRERRDLVPLLRNPFSLTLVGSFVEASGGLPDSQSQLYGHYIKEAVDSSRLKLSELSITATNVEECAVAIASAMFAQGGSGLEASLPTIVAQYPALPIDKSVQVLAYSRLIRLTKAGTSLSFAHRRFAEYLVASNLRVTSSAARDLFEEIGRDSRWREVLVLYSEVLPFDEAVLVVEVCLEKIERLDALDRLTGIHALRFLVDAFRTRRDIVAHRAAELSSLIDKYLSDGRDLVLSKIALEAVALLPESQALARVTQALSLHNSWLSETAMKACRNFPSLKPEIEREVMLFIDSWSSREVIRRRKELLFGLALSDALAGLRKHYLLRILDVCSSTAAIIVVGIAAPVLLMQGTVLATTMVFMGPVASVARRRRVVEALQWVGAAALCLIPFLPAPWREIFRVGSLISEDGTWRWTSVVAGMLLIPIHRVGFWLHFKLWKRAWTFLPKFAGGLVLAAGSIGLLALVGTWFVSFVPPWTVAGVAVIGSLALSVAVLRDAAVWLRDYFILRQILRAPPSTREEIGSTLCKLRTEWAQLKFVRHLAIQGVVPSGSWPSEDFLAVGAEAGKTALARLEERCGWDWSDSLLLAWLDIVCMR